MWLDIIPHPVIPTPTHSVTDESTRACILSSAFYAGEALEKIYKKGYRYRKGKIVLARLFPETHVQGNLFETPPNDRKATAAAGVEKINRKNGYRVMSLAAEKENSNWQGKAQYLSPAYTTRWDGLLQIV